MNEQIRNIIAEINQGKVPDGYKKVLSSTVYEDYIETTFGELFDFYGGLGIPRDQLSDNGYPYLHYGDMHRESFTKVSVEQYNELPKYDIKISGNETFLLEDGDVVFLDASEDLEGTSRSVMVDNPENATFISGLHTFIAREKHDTLAKDYKQYITMTDYVKKQFMKLASGFKVYGLNRNSIKDIVFAYPQDKHEQQKNAEILMKWDEAVSLQEKLIEKLELQKKALMQRLLNPQKNWKKIKIGELVQEKTMRNKNDCQNVLSVSNRYGFIKQEEQFSKQVASADVKNYKVINKGDIAYNPSRINVGSIALYENEEPGIVSPMYIVVECKKINPTLLLLLLNTSKGKYNIESFLSGSVRDSLNYSDLAEIEVHLPDDIIADKIINLNKTISKQLLVHQQKLNAIKLQQKSLMQLLLTGIVRV